MITALVIYWILAAIYCGASIVKLRITNVSLLICGIFAPILCWVIFGARLVGGRK